MKVGDLIKMKHEMWWRLDQRKNYTDECGIVYAIAGKGVKIFMPDNSIKVSLADYWEIINEIR